MLFHRYRLAETCSFHIEPCCVHGFHVDIIAIDVVGEVAFFRIIVVDGVEEFLIEVGPFLECKRFAKHTGIDVACDEGSFDEQCARAAHGIDEIGVGFPAAH